MSAASIDPPAASVRELMDASGVPFGTSGVRGLADAMTDRLCYAYTTAFLGYLASIGEFHPGMSVALAGDLRPSTPRILAACGKAVLDAGGQPLNCGRVPTPALALYAMGEGMPSLMVTGSHIPEDRNGIKFYRPHGEVLKDDEAGIVGQRPRVDPALFDTDGALAAAFELPAEVDVIDAYVARYTGFFGGDALLGMTIGVYQHSAVGRDVLVRIVEELGALAIPLGRSGHFIPVDTEAIRPEDIELARNWASERAMDAIISTDGDSDRPLVATAAGEWVRGDLLGLLCARAIGADCVVTPVSSNTAVELCGAFPIVRRTRIGSPYVIAAMMEEAAKAKAASVCGYEANGGFLLGSALSRDGRTLTALPTRDAVLPIVAALTAAKGGALADVVAALPPRVTFSDRIAGFPTKDSQAIVSYLQDGAVEARMARAATYFGELAGAPAAIDTTDGIRISFANGSIIHLRPSGNAPEIRCYTEADDEMQARLLNQRALGIVREQLLPGARAAALSEPARP